jgi:hypothetical protein
LASHTSPATLVEEDPKPEDTPVADAATSGAGVAVAATPNPKPGESNADEKPHPSDA